MVNYFNCGAGFKIQIVWVSKVWGWITTPERFHPGIFQRSEGEIHLGFLDTDMVSVTTLLPGHQQHLHKNYRFGWNVSLLMGFFQNAVVMHCKQEQGNVSGWLNQTGCYKVSWDRDSGNSLWHNQQQGQEGLQLCWTRKWSFRVAMRFPHVTKSLQRNREAEQAELTFHVHG